MDGNTLHDSTRNPLKVVRETRVCCCKFRPSNGLIAHPTMVCVPWVSAATPTPAMDRAMIEAFHTPQTIQEALELYHALGDGTWFLGGGTVLNTNTPPPGRQKAFISLAELGLTTITRTADGLELGSGCTLQALIEAPLVPQVLKAACRQVDSRNIRNQATLGGHIAARHPYAALLPILLALDAQVMRVTSRGPSTLPIAQQLMADEPALITAVRIPPAGLAMQAAVAKHSRSAIDLALVTIAVACRLEAGYLQASAIIVGGLTPLPHRLHGLEAQLQGHTLPPRDTIEAEVRRSVQAEDIPRASAEFQRTIAGVLVADALYRIGGSDQEVPS